MEQGGGTGAPRDQEPVGRPFENTQSPGVSDEPSLATVTGVVSSGSSSGIGRIVALVVPIGTSLLFAVLWFVIGGLPFADHDEHGIVPIQGSGQAGRAQPQTVSLDEGEYYLYFEERGLSDNDTVDAPDGLEVTVSEGAGPKGAAVDVTDVPGFLFSSQTNDVGWEPVGRFDADGGEYTVSAQARSSYGNVTIGNPPINPFGPPIVGSILIVLLGIASSVLISRIRAFRSS